MALAVWFATTWFVASGSPGDEAGVGMQWDELGPEGVPTGRVVAASDRFTRGSPDWSRAVFETPATELGYVARHTAAELREQVAAGAPLASAGMFARFGVTMDDVLATLDLIDRTAAEDRGELHQRLLDPEWVAAHFDWYRWSSDTEAAAARKVTLEPGELRLTKYLVYQSAGSPERTGPFDTALWALPDAEAAGGPPTDRMAFTRQDVYGGVYEAGGAAEGRARPLVWLSRVDANRALLQGSVEVLRGEHRQMYNVHENNGIPYDPAVKDGNLQRRFWYFRPVVGTLGVEQIPLRPHAAVAGDIWNLGLGKLVALEWDGPLGPEVHLVVLADTGGAFQPNLFQLDWLAGTFASHEAFAAWEATMPSRVRAGILIRKREG
ncbi:MAG: hypothetical protein ABMA64_29370 [Myxococcota bacterium]